MLILAATGVFLFFLTDGARPVYAVVTSESVAMSQEDQATVRKALAEIRKGRWSRAENLIASTRDPLAAKLYYWLYYTQDGKSVSFERISSFIRQNPDWPYQARLLLNAERALPANLPNKELLGWFDAHNPETAEGLELYLRALLQAGRRGDAQTLMRRWWKTALFSPAEQQGFLARYGFLIDEQTHVARFGYLLQRGHYTNARVIARLLGHGYPALAEARIALAEGQTGVDAAIARVPAILQNDPGLLLERLRWRRRHNNDFGALEIMHNMPPVEIIPNPEEWWEERNIMARRLIDEGRYESAYLLLEKHVQEKGVPFAEAEFMAGWLALSFLDKPWKAFEHFEALYYRTKTPISRSRGAYWAGKASESLGQPAIAKKWFQAAAKYQTAFYGQLALEELDESSRPPRQQPPQKTLYGSQIFENKEKVQVAKLLAAAGMRSEASAFLIAIGTSAKTPEEFRLAAELADSLGHEHDVVKIAKKAMAHGVLLMDQAYPTMLSQMASIPIEWALVHALIRQESGFDYAISSPAGAQGLMQLMPGTARDIARRHKIAHRDSWLTSRPEYNIKLGSLYLEQMLDRYDSSYPLALAAYNAGPGRVDQWIRDIGDPRTGDINMVDWIEHIPYKETRNYVQRVLENVYVYRTKMASVQNSVAPPLHVALERTSNPEKTQ